MARNGKSLRRMRKGQYMKKTGYLGYLLAVAMSLAAGVAVAESNDLEQFLDQVKTMSGSFEQVIVDAAGEELDRTKGQFWIQRPGLLRWVYQEPYQQLVVVDGKKVWIHDPDLDQVSVRPIDPASAGPAVLLLFDRSSIQQQYRIVEVERSLVQGAASRVRLAPLAQSQDFIYLDLLFQQGKLAALIMQDTLQQTTKVSISDLQVNQRIAPSRFVFIPPAGTDVVEQ